MRTSDISMVIFILLTFISLFAFNILSVGIANIRDNWPLYRCNPMIMPFASVFGKDPGENFSYCIRTMQSDYMGFLLQPINYNLALLGDIGGGLGDAVNSAREMFGNLRSSITDIIENVFGVFLNMVVEMQRLTINVKDMFGKMLGIMATMVHTLSGSVMTMQSMWGGPPGQLMKKAMCFKPDTEIRLINGEKRMMQRLELGDLLEDGSRVEAVMRIINTCKDGSPIEAMYAIERNGDQAKNGNQSTNNHPTSSTHVIVSGSHLIHSDDLGNFIRVDQIGTELVNGYKVGRYDGICSELACLITDTHLIPIGVIFSMIVKMIMEALPKILVIDNLKWN
jgi:hypothetical protein